MIDYDFIEIGTSDFNTIVEKCPEDAVGLCVEPIKKYLDSLPSKKNVKKINCAISFDGSNGEVDVFYIKDNVLKENKLSHRMKGCNSINDYHYLHKKLNITHLVTKEKVKKISIKTLLEENTVRGINHLKIDTEGGDCFILKCLIDYIKDKEICYWPKKITFETNILTKKELILETIEQYKNIGYAVLSLGNFEKDDDTVLILNHSNKLF